MHGQPGLGLLSRNRISQIPVTFVTSALRGGDAEEERSMVSDGMASEEGPHTGHPPRG